MHFSIEICRTAFAFGETANEKARKMLLVLITLLRKPLSHTRRKSFPKLVFEVRKVTPEGRGGDLAAREPVGTLGENAGITLVLRTRYGIIAYKIPPSPPYFSPDVGSRYAAQVLHKKRCK
ncbi:hypothetical protein Pelo_17983 [Pelomyxa schiedti]|nr:hypothetical protein Pelo_17983 [Pelomyxa schiedti]